MENTLDMLAKLLVNQQKQLERLTALAEAQTNCPPGSPSATGKPAVHIEVKKPTLVELAGLMDTFVYEPRNGYTFDAWYGRYTGVFKGEAAHLGDAGKVQLLLMKMDTTANKLYRDTIAPKESDAFKFDETVDQLKTLFNPKESLFRKRFNTLQLRRD